MRDYQKKRREREPLVRGLYELGLSAREISEIIPWSPGAIAQDITRLGGPAAFPNRPANKQDTFAAVLSRYAQITVAYTEDTCELTDDDHKIQKALAVWLREDWIFSTLGGIALTLQALTVPSYPVERKWYARFLGMLLGRVVSTPPLYFMKGDIKSLRQEMLRVIQSKKQPVPTSQMELRQMIVTCVLDKQRAEIMPIWDENVFVLVDEMLGILTERERDLICKRFGLGFPEPQSLELIALFAKVTRERLRQIEAKAIRKLQRYAEQHGFSCFVNPVGNALERELIRKREIQNVFSSPYVSHDEPIDPELALRSVNTLYLSILTENCLFNCDIKLIGELIQKTEIALLHSQNIGRRSLREIKGELAKLKLQLNTQVSENLQSMISARRAEMTRNPHHEQKPKQTALTTFELAQEILGCDFISPKEIAAARKLTYSEAQIAELEQTLPDKETLAWLHQNDYMLVAGPPLEMSLLDLRELERSYFRNPESGWYNDSRETFAQREKVACCWYMIRTTIVPRSTSMMWGNQESILSHLEMVPTAVELVWALTCYYAVRGVYLLENLYARTSSTNMVTNHVGVGYFNDKGLNFNARLYETCADDLGIASARKPS